MSAELTGLYKRLDSIETPPIDVISIARAQGLKVYTVPGWENRISGMIKKSKEDGGESGYAIYVNANHLEARQRFTIAHELAHYLQHRNLIGDGVVEDGLYRSGFGDLIEIEANDIAAKILMPELLLRNIFAEIVTENPDINITRLRLKLAKKFGVSSQAMAIRLRVANIF